MPSHATVAHAWANQTGKNRRGFNMYYEGDTIYSYGSHFPIARIVDAQNGERVALFTTVSSSISTAKHKSHVRCAIPNNIQVFEVEHVGAGTPKSHRENHVDLIERAGSAVEKAKRARTRKDWHLRRADDLIEQANGYNAAFDLGLPEVTLETLAADVAELRRVAAEVAERERVERERISRERLREHKADLKPNLRAWLNGEKDGNLYWHHAYGSRPFCRIKGDNVETSWGASVPLKDALRLFRLATRCRKAGKGWKPEGLNNVRVGDFALREIGPTGNVVVGCHDIPYRYAKLAVDKAGISLDRALEVA